MHFILFPIFGCVMARQKFCQSMGLQGGDNFRALCENYTTRPLTGRNCSTHQHKMLAVVDIKITHQARAFFVPSSICKRTDKTALASWKLVHSERCISAPLNVLRRYINDSICGTWETLQFIYNNGFNRCQGFCYKTVFCSWI